MPRTSLFLALFATGLVACETESDPQDDGNKGPEEDYSSGGCLYTSTVVASDEVTALGFSGEEVQAATKGLRSETLIWSADESSTELNFELSFEDGEVRLMEGEAAQGDTGVWEAVALECEDYLELDATLSFATADGVFDEVLWVTASADAADQTNLGITLDLDEVAGSYLPSEIPSDATSAELSIYATITADSSEGRIGLNMSGSDGNTAWASTDEVGYWPTEE